MAQETDNLVLEHLRHIHGKVDGIDERLGRVEVRLSVIQGHLGHMFIGEAGQNVDLDRLKRRVERIERRLELTDPIE
jgi:hypothetical protein